MPLPRALWAWERGRRGGRAAQAPEPAGEPGSEMRRDELAKPGQDWQLGFGWCVILPYWPILSGIGRQPLLLLSAHGTSVSLILRQSGIQLSV